jgi:hypothetical protein
MRVHVRLKLVAIAALLGACSDPGDADVRRFAEAALVSSDGALSATAFIQRDWGASYCMEVKLVNTRATPTSTWSLGINLGNSLIVQQWNAEFTARTGAIIALPSGNAVIPARGQITLGFCANGSSRAVLTSVQQSGASGSPGDTSDGVRTDGSGGAASGAHHPEAARCRLVLDEGSASTPALLRRTPSQASPPQHAEGPERAD